MTKQEMIKRRYIYLYKKKCLKQCKNICDLIKIIIDSNNINLQDLYNLDNCKSFKRKEIL